MNCGRASTSARVASQKEPHLINVLFVCDEWKSSKGGLSTFNREFAINVAKTASDKIRVHCYVSQSSELDREDARKKCVNIITAKSVPGTSDPQEWLRLPPPELSHPDLVIGHGRKFGIPAYWIARTTHSKWVQFVHVFCEDLGKYKLTAKAGLDTIEENEKKNKAEIEFCKAADAIVAVGARLQRKYSRTFPKIEIITPGILKKFFSESTELVKAIAVLKTFNVFMFGRADFEDLRLKGYDLVANAIGSLGKKFELTFVGSPAGEHRNIENWFTENTSIKRNQITIRSYCTDQDELKRMFYEADLVAMPSRTEGFGLVALEAISASIPVLVTSESGIAEALEKVDGGQSVIVESEDPEEWLKKIRLLSEQKAEERHDSAIHLKENYEKTYSWEEECGKFTKMILGMLEDSDKDATCNVVVHDESVHIAPVQDDMPTFRPESKGSEAADSLYDNLPLEQIPWYFGKVTRKSAETFLQRHDPGTFLVRDSGTAQKPGCYSISLRGRGRDSYRHQEIESLPNGKLVLKGHKNKHFPTVAASVQYFAKCFEGSILLVPLVKEKGRCLAWVLTFLCLSVFSLCVYCSVSSIHQKPVPADSKDSDRTSAKAVNSLPDKIEVLHSATKNGNIELIEFILSLGLDIDSRSSDGTTPLMFAAAYDKPVAFQLLVQHGADPSLKNNHGWSLLHSAAEGGNTSIINKLLSLGLNINLRNSYGTTPLMVAAVHDKPDAFQYLIQHDANPYLKDNNGCDVMSYAADGGNTAIIDKLSSLGLHISRFLMTNDGFKCFY